MSSLIMFTAPAAHPVQAVGMQRASTSAMKRLFFIALILAAASLSADVVLPVGGAPQILIPVAGSIAGGNGTFFRSDIAVVNLTAHDQLVVATWIPQVGTGTATSTSFTIPAQTGIRSADFVVERLNQTGLGAILLTGVTSFTPGGSIVPDANAVLYASNRIWTPQPGTSGTTSQSLPAIPFNTINTPAAALFDVGGADNPAAYRTNVGIVNVDPTVTQTFSIVAFTPGAPAPTPIMTLTLPPMTMQQVSAGSGLAAGTQINVNAASVNGSTVTTRWIAYGSNVNNVTGDAWSELAVVGTRP